MDSKFDYANLARILEDQELESPSGQTSRQVYGQLLAIYLLFNDLTSAKFLWKRIPSNLKLENNELSLIWSVGKLMWKKDYAHVCGTIDSVPAWPNHLKNIMKLISESNRQRLISLISRAYSTISLVNACQLLGMNESDTLKLAEQLQWTYERDTGFLVITQQPSSSASASCDKNPASASAPACQTAGVRRSATLAGLDNGTELLKKLTEYIVFLESAK